MVSKKRLAKRKKMTPKQKAQAEDKAIEKQVRELLVQQNTSVRSAAGYARATIERMFEGEKPATRRLLIARAIQYLYVDFHVGVTQGPGAPNPAS